MIEWKEREHELNDVAALQSHRSRAALRNYNLLKFFKMQNMKKEVLLLEYMIGLWNTTEQGFQIGTQLLTIELENVYFLTGLSKRGAPVILSGQRALLVPVEQYLANHCVPRSRLVGGRIAIKDVRDLPLRSILFAITTLARSTSSHLVSRSQVAYGLQCLEPTVFNWSVAFLQNVKEQISRCRTGQQKQFGYGSFLVAVRPANEPRMERWTSLSPRLGMESEFRFTGDFFTWLRCQLIVIKDFPYIGVDFRGSMDLVLPDGMDWDASGEKPKQSCQVFFYFKVYIIFWGT
jgi:hypothetical protein